MAEIVLIPGYATELSGPFRPVRGLDGGFGAFIREIIVRQAIVYRWGIREHVSLFDLLNPLFLVGFYRRERSLAAAPTTLAILNALLEQHQPKQIVCHSMGCFLLAEYLQSFQLPSSVQSVVFIQADLPTSVMIKSCVSIENLYCPWDPTLLLSSSARNYPSWTCWDQKKRDKK